MPVQRDIMELTSTPITPLPIPLVVGKWCRTFQQETIVRDAADLIIILVRLLAECKAYYLVSIAVVFAFVVPFR